MQLNIFRKFLPFCLFLFLFSFNFAQNVEFILPEYGIFIYEDYYGYYYAELIDDYYYLSFYPNVLALDYFPSYEIVYYEDYYFIPSYEVYLYPLPDGYYPYGIPDYVGLPSDAYANIPGSAGNVSIEKNITVYREDEKEKVPEFNYRFEKRNDYGFESINEKVYVPKAEQKTYYGDVVAYEIPAENEENSSAKFDYPEENICKDILIIAYNQYLKNPEFKFKVANNTENILYIDSIYINSDDADFFVKDARASLQNYQTKEFTAELKELKNNSIDATISVLGRFYNGKSCNVNKKISLYAEPLNKFYSCDDIKIEMPKELDPNKNYFLLKISNPTDKTISAELIGNGISLSINKIEVKPKTYVEKKIYYTLENNAKNIEVKFSESCLNSKIIHISKNANLSLIAKDVEISAVAKLMPNATYTLEIKLKNNSNVPREGRIYLSAADWKISKNNFPIMLKENEERIITLSATPNKPLTKVRYIPLQFLENNGNVYFTIVRFSPVKGFITAFLTLGNSLPGILVLVALILAYFIRKKYFTKEERIRKRRVKAKRGSKKARRR